jgi:virginiamycin B lyase
MFNKSLSPLVAAGLLGSVFPSVAQQPGQDFPDGAAKNTVVTVCSGCHDLNRLTAGYTPEGWRRTVVRMMQNFGAPLSQDEARAVTEYLTESFPEKPRLLWSSSPVLWKPPSQCGRWQHPAD